MTEVKAMGIGGDGGSGDIGDLGDLGMGLGSDAGSSGMGIGVSAGGTEGETGGAAASLGFGTGGDIGDIGGIGDAGAGGPSSSGVIAPISTQVPTVGESVKVTENKAAIKRSARRRSLLGEEEGGLTPIGVYRRSILGS